jgi:hypothetical protein
MRLSSSIRLDDAVGAAPGTVTTSERPEQQLADPLGLTASAASQNSSAAAVPASRNR